MATFLVVGEQGRGQLGVLGMLAYALLALAVLAMRGTYRKGRLEARLLDEIGRVLAATSIAAIALIAASVIDGSSAPPAPPAVWLWALATASLSIGRVGVTVARRWAYARLESGASTIVIGAGKVGRRVAERLLRHPELGFRPIGFLDKDPLGPASGPTAGLPVLGASWDLEEAVDRYRVRHVIVAFSTAPDTVLLDVVRRCRRLGVNVLTVPRLFEEVTHRVSVRHLGGIALMGVEYPNPHGVSFAIKHAFDRIAAALLIAVLAPLLVAIALSVRLSTPGPVLYRERRVGRDGREFVIFKFRTMTGTPLQCGEADARWAAVQVKGAIPETPAMERRTAVGRFLRRWSLDELPQLFNVLAGQMSLVGPRPERWRYARVFEEHIYRYGDRYRVKSGLTGWAQVHGLRGETSLPERIEWDNYYIENWTLWLDLKILLRTVPALIYRPRA